MGTRGGRLGASFSSVAALAWTLEPTNFAWIRLRATETLGFSVKKFLTPFCATHVSIINSDPTRIFRNIHGLDTEHSTTIKHIDP